MSDISNPIIENALQGNLVELSQRNEQTHLQIRTLNEMVVSLRKENAKLRELIKDMWRDIPKSEACAWDSSANTCIGSDSCIGECSYWYRMVKLGIEVTENE